jgi:hypothetical protein
MEAGGVVSSSSWSREQCSMMAALQVKVRPAGPEALAVQAFVLTMVCLASTQLMQQGFELPYAKSDAGASCIVLLPFPWFVLY